MEKASPVGIALGLVMIFGTIFAGGGWGIFFDVPSIALVLGGTFSGLLVGHSFDDIKAVGAGTKGIFTFQEPDNHAALETFVELSRVARREGLLALDRQIASIDDEFTRMGLELAVDGIDEREITDLLRNQLKTEVAAKQLIPKFYNTAATLCPAFGMIGTLIGLIQMMQNLTDPSAIGAGMAVAMITTFYGALVANLFLLPLANKSKAQVEIFMRNRAIIQTGVISIVRGDSPNMVDQRLSRMLGGGGKTGQKAETSPELAAAA